jgi:putative colanic acid biosynthesis acetyltransferase WcaF
VRRSFALTVARVSAGNRVRRVLWGIAWTLLYRPSPRPLHGWRRFLLRCFGAHSCLADHVDCYCVAPVTVGEHATVSQYSHLCSASHDYNDPAFPLVVAPIVIGRESWVAAGVFVGPGVMIGEGAVVGARSTVTEDISPWTVVAGCPARRRGDRAKFSRASV